jgi:hypothetical protein
MLCGDFSALLTIVGTIVTCSAAILTLAALSRDLRIQIEQQIRRLDGSVFLLRLPLKAAVNIWLSSFFTLFGQKFASWQFFVFTPIYTVTISVVVLVLWIVPLYIHFYSTHSLREPAYMDEITQIEIGQWFWRGIFIAVVIDYFTVFFTKLNLRILLRWALGPLAFAGISVLLTFFIYYVFTLVIYILRVYDMATLYEWNAPYDPFPVMEYELFPLSLEDWVRLRPPMILHATSRGLINTYFFPEPILFYCMIATAYMLPFLAIIYVLISLVRRAVHAFLVTFRVIPEIQGANYIVLICAGMFTVSVILMWCLNYITGRCLPPN